MPLTIMNGCSLSDVGFTLDARIAGEEITWNVTKIQRDADAGLFGKPIGIAMASLPPMTDEDRANVDWLKEAHIMKDPAVLATPVLAIGSSKRAGDIFCFVDGNHRICARMEAGLAGFESYVVPAELERCYRIITTVIKD
jgi:hypothetical protein